MTEPVATPVTLLAAAKLTLSLRIVGTRADGYHLIDAEMVSLDLYDELEVGPGEGVTLGGQAAGDLAGLSDDNLVSRALAVVDRRAAVRVDKRIPAGAGLGGGSSDAAAILRHYRFDDLAAAARLGADVAFCVRGGRARVTGIGDIVEPLEFRPATYTLLTPAIHASTPVVYRKWDELGGPAGDNGNDLEPAALAAYPELARGRDRLHELSGQRPRLAGSGSTWFVDGAFSDEETEVVRTIPPQW